MQKLIVLLLVIAAVCNVCSAVPIDLEEEYVEAPRADRVARATCDLLSASINGNSLNHSACAAHCLVLGKGFRGGRCINGVCHCRK